MKRHKLSAGPGKYIWSGLWGRAEVGIVFCYRCAKCLIYQYDLLCITYICKLTCLGRLMGSSILRQCSCRSCRLGRARWEYGHCYDPCSSSWKTPRTGCVLAVLAYWGEFGDPCSLSWKMGGNFRTAHVPRPTVKQMWWTDMPKADYKQVSIYPSRTNRAHCSK